MKLWMSDVIFYGVIALKKCIFLEQKPEFELSNSSDVGC